MLEFTKMLSSAILTAIWSGWSA